MAQQPRQQTPPMVWVFNDPEKTLECCPVLLGVCIASVVGFVLQKVINGERLNFTRVMVFYPPTLKAGEVWRLLTHALLHSDFSHLLMNVFHILVNLDMEAVLPDIGYPSKYNLGSYHVAQMTALVVGYGALVGSVASFGAMFMGVSSLCFGLDGAVLTACGLLLGSGKVDPGLQSFYSMRCLYAVVFMAMDVVRGCSSPEISGNVSHAAGFLAGICYMFIAQPDLGGKPIPTVPCGIKLRPSLLEKATSGVMNWFQPQKATQCFAFYQPQNTIQVNQALVCAEILMLVGVVAALVNAFILKRDVHPSADGYSIFVSPPPARPNPSGQLAEQAARLQAARSGGRGGEVAMTQVPRQARELRQEV